MVAVGEWQKYEESYLKYGVDLQPDAEGEAARRRQKAALKRKQRPKIRVRASDKVLALILILAIAICSFAVICLEAYQSDINYNIYKINQESQQVNREIDDLSVSLNGQDEMAAIEEYASGSLGLSYPTQEQYMYVGDLKGTSDVNDYVTSLAAEQRGAEIQEDLSPAEAASRLLS